VTDPRIVIGASHAGSELAAKLRQLDPSVPVLLLGDEGVLPYQHPPLSKSWLGNPTAAIESLLIRNAAAYENAGVEVRMQARVAAIDRGAQRLRLESGESLPYSQLALAMGARVRRLSLPNAERINNACNLHYLRTFADAERLRPQFTPGARIVIVGGGYIGLEIAALAVKQRLTATVLEAQSRVLARVTAPELSAFYERVHREAGVDLRCGLQVTGFEFSSDGRVRQVLWQDADGAAGSTDADIVVVGIGVLPNMELAQTAGIACADGILVDDLCRTSDPAIVAAGDCTCRPVPGQPAPLRIESVPNAAEQARTAAATLCGQQVPCNSVPWFWSDQYDLKLQMVGLSRGHDTVVIRGDMGTRTFCVFYLKEGQIIAADAVSRPAEFMMARRLVGASTRAETADLADPAFNLKELLSA
jgi:3-phenylpropionate/trans-cinnamate dioxygenase ferredoxin reductase component